MSHKAAIAVDLGATNLRVALVSDGGDVMEKTTVPTPTEGADGRVVTTCIIAQIQKLLEGYDGDIEGIGVTATGPLNIHTGQIEKPTNLQFDCIPLIAPLSETFSYSVILSNDANAAVYAEKFFGQGRDINNLVYVTISSGIGAGAIVDGQLLWGANGNVGEVGNFFVDSAIAMPPDKKGRQTEWGRVVSGSKIIAFFDAWMAAHAIERNAFAPKDAAELYAAGAAGHPLAVQFLNDVARIHAHGLTNIIAAYDPELIVLGGSVVLCNKDFFMELLMKHMAHATVVSVPPLQITELGDSIGLLGAAALVFDRQE